MVDKLWRGDDWITIYIRKNQTRQTTPFRLLFFQPLCRVGRLRFTHIDPAADRDADRSPTEDVDRTRINFSR